MNTTRNPEALRHALRRTPPHLVLLVREDRAELYQSRGETLARIAEEDFPLLRVASLGGEDLGTFLRRVDNAFGKVRGRHPSPMVLAGPADLLTAFAELSENLYRLAGLVTGRATETEEALHHAARSLVEPYLLSREAEALWTLEHALNSRPEHVVAGIEACAAVVHRARPMMLVAEKGLSDSRQKDLEQLMEHVIDDGGWIALAHDGALEQHSRVALVLDTPAPDRPFAEEEAAEAADGSR